MCVRQPSSTNRDKSLNFSDKEFFQLREVHQAFHMLQNFSLSILLGLRCSVSSDLTLNNFVRRKYARPLLFRKQFLFFVGLSERNFGIRIVVTDPIISRRCLERNWIG